MTWRALQDALGNRSALTITESGIVGGPLKTPVLWVEVDSVWFETDASGPEVHLSFLNSSRAREVRTMVSPWWLWPIARWVSHSEAILYIEGYDAGDVVYALSMSVPDQKFEPV